MSVLMSAIDMLDATYPYVMLQWCVIAVVKVNNSNNLIWNWHKVDPEHMVTMFTFTGFVEEANYSCC